MRLYLVRHGQTAWNAELRAQGHTDIPLDEQGLQQAAQVGEAFRRIPLSAVLSSDLARSAETARPIAAATGADLKLMLELRERAFGDFEGLAFDDLHARMAKKRDVEGCDAWSVCPPSGESVRDTWTRLGPVAEMLSGLNRDVCVVTHGGSCALLLSKLVGANIEASRAFRFSNASVTELTRRLDESFYIVRYNDTAHLSAGRPLAGSLEGSAR
jgi:2,3-bisphosphoglycerate-dependent phosphoglycerate mutase